MAPIKRRITRSKQQKEEPNIGIGKARLEEIEIETQTENLTSVDPMPQYISTEQEFTPKSAIDEIRAELSEERSAPSVELEYEDESHSWETDNESESEDYWHFLGRYE